MYMNNGQPPLIDTVTGGLNQLWVQWYSHRTGSTIQDTIAAGTIQMLELQQRMIGFIREHTINPRGVAAGYMPTPFGMPNYGLGSMGGGFMNSGFNQEPFFNGGDIFTNYFRDTGRYPAGRDEPSLFFKEDVSPDHPWVRYMSKKAGSSRVETLMEMCTGMRRRLIDQPRLPDTNGQVFDNAGPAMVTPGGYLSLLWVMWQGDRDHNRSLEVIHDEGMKIIESERDKPL